jgi:hypothetical protein
VRNPRNCASPRSLPPLGSQEEQRVRGEAKPMNYMGSFGMRGATWPRTGPVRRPRSGPWRRQPTTEYALAAAIVLMLISIAVLGTIGF